MKLADRDWPGTIAMALMLALALFCALLDPSCRRSVPPGAHSIRMR